MKLTKATIFSLGQWLKLPSIPFNEVILFESDVTVLGYELQDDVDDELIYITKGSAAGGETGGTQKSGSAWGHTHTVSVSVASGGAHSHTILAHSHGVAHIHATRGHVLTLSEIPSHTHSVVDQTYTSSSGPAGTPTWSGRQSVPSGAAGGGSSHNHGDTYDSSISNTDSVALTSETGGEHTHTGSGASDSNEPWRPLGRNFTRQKRI
jgi:hypothetical protein